MLNAFLEFCNEPVIPYRNKTISLKEYLSVDRDEDDEQDIVDRIFTQNIFQIMGYGSGDYFYNRNRLRNRPDFILRPEGKVILCWENKSTREDLDSKQTYSQVSRYSSSISDKVILCNAREIRLYRKSPGAEIPQLKLSINIEEILGLKSSLFEAQAKDALSFLLTTFSKQEQTNLNQVLQNLRCDFNQWKERALDVNSYFSAFVEASQPVLSLMQIEAFNSLESDLIESSQCEKKLRYLGVRVLKINDRLRPRIKSGKVDDFKELINDLSKSLLQSDILINDVIDCVLKPDQAIFESQLRILSTEAKTLVSHYYSESLNTLSLFMSWKEKHKSLDIYDEEMSPEEYEKNFKIRFSREASYAFLMKVFIIRVMEDKQLIPRILSNGGLDDWISLLERRKSTSAEEFLRGRQLLEDAIDQASKIYSGIKGLDIFDWYFPSDLMILKILSFLNNYDLSQIRHDVIGLTYQDFITHEEQHSSGRFLTPPDVAEMILESAGYKAGNTQILGHRVIDIACGSGSILVHAIIRYKQEFYRNIRNVPTYRNLSDNELAPILLNHIEDNFYGLDLDPFSIYLANLNFFIQILDEIAISRCNEEVFEPVNFNIYNTDSLDFRTVIPFELLSDSSNLLEYAQNTEDSSFYDPAETIKAEGKACFQWVFANPPYINPKTETFTLQHLRKDAFYNGYFAGDINAYAPFFRVGIYYLQPDGILAYIQPQTIFADLQTIKLRQKLIADAIPLRIVRFYSRTGIFHKVKQAVSITVLQKQQASMTDVKCEILGSKKPPEEATLDLPDKAVINASDMLWEIKTPAQDPYRAIIPADRDNFDTWLAVPDGRIHAMWKQVSDECRENSLGKYMLARGINPEKHFNKGDLNTSSVHLFNARNNEFSAPVYRAGTIYYLSPLVDDPNPLVSCGKLVRRVQPRVDDNSAANRKFEKIFSSEKPIYGLVLNEFGLFETMRCLRPTPYSRYSKSPKIFADTLMVIETPDEMSAFFITGLICSNIFTNLYASLSAGNHVNKRILLSLPVPKISKEMEEQIAVTVKSAYTAAGEFLKTISPYQINLRGGLVDLLSPSWLSVDNKKVQSFIDPSDFIKNERISTIRFENLLANQVLKHYGKSKKPSSILNEIEGNEDWKKVTKVFSSSVSIKKAPSISDVIFPSNPSLFNSKWEVFISTLEKQSQQFVNSMKSIDLIIAEFYGVRNWPEDGIFIPWFR